MTADTGTAPRGGLSFGQRAVKRAFDVAVSMVALAMFGWLIVLAAGLARIDTGKSGIFRQLRVGRHGRLFEVMKIRTMRDRPGINTTTTAAGDPRITRLGQFFRRTKIDELPQFLNVLRGEMSLVGPRPDVPGYADRLTGRDRVILSVRPGITGPATLKYRDEESLLASQDDPQLYNDKVIFPDKAAINRSYVEHYSFFKDLSYLWLTVFPPR